MTESLHGLRLSRFYNYERSVYLPAPTGGWNPTTNPWEMPENQAQLLDNFVVRAGEIVQRASIAAGEDVALNVTGTYTAGPINPAGVAVGLTSTNAAWLQITRRVASVNQVDPWNAVTAKATAVTLASADAHAIVYTASGVPQSVAITKDQTPGPRWIDFDGLLYGISYDASTAPVTFPDTNANYVARATNLLTLPLVQTGSTLPTARLNAPRGAFDLKGYLSRIWLLGGVDIPGGLAVHEATTLYYTNPGTSGVGAASADWKDPVSGLVNKIRMDNDIMDCGVGLGLVSNAMVIFRRSSVWVLRGNTSASFQLQPISREVGCIDARTIVETDQGIYFLSQRGLMFTDGAVVQNVSGVMMSVLQTAINQYNLGLFNGGASFTAGWATMVHTSKTSIVLSLGTYSNTGASSPIFAAMYDYTNNVWMGIGSSIYQDTADASLQAAFGGSIQTLYPTAFFRRGNPDLLFTVGNKYVTQWENLELGASFLNVDQIQNTGGWQQTGVDTVPPSFTANSVIGIPSRWITRFVPTITTGARKFAIVKRYSLDYIHTGGGGVAAVPWTITPVDASATALSSPVTVAAATTAQVNLGPVNNASLTGVPSIMRQNTDFLSEITNELAFDIRQPSTSPAQGPIFAKHLIFGIDVEYQSTRDAR